MPSVPLQPNEGFTNKQWRCWCHLTLALPHQVLQWLHLLLPGDSQSSAQTLYFQLRKANQMLMGFLITWCHMVLRWTTLHYRMDHIFMISLCLQNVPNHVIKSSSASCWFLNMFRPRNQKPELMARVTKGRRAPPRQAHMRRVTGSARSTWHTMLLGQFQHGVQCALFMMHAQRPCAPIKNLLRTLFVFKHVILRFSGWPTVKWVSGQKVWISILLCWTMLCRPAHSVFMIRSVPRPTNPLYTAQWQCSLSGWRMSTAEGMVLAGVQWWGWLQAPSHVFLYSTLGGRSRVKRWPQQWIEPVETALVAHRTLDMFGLGRSIATLFMFWAHAWCRQKEMATTTKSWQIMRIVDIKWCWTRCIEDSWLHGVSLLKHMQSFVRPNIANRFS